MTASIPIPAFEGLDNFRDFGGYATEGGRRVKRGWLYRSAHHGRATDADLIGLCGLGLATIVDLRRPEERQRDPCRRWDGFAATVVDNDLSESPADTYEDHLKTADLSVGGLRVYLKNYYQQAPFKARHIDLYSRYFNALASGDGPILIHCAAGKDRTGILAALTHHLLGVSYADSLVDYLLTNDPARIERRLPMYAQHVTDTIGRRPTDDFVRATLGVEALYLDTAVLAIEAKYGAVDAYLEEALGVDAATRAEIRRRLLE
jgi:protein-tyrosine phosphatase